MSMSTKTLHLTCRCAYDAGDVQPRTPDRPRRRPRIGGYLVSTPRNMPRGVLGRRLAERQRPEPPPKPAPLPNPVQR